MSMAGGCEVGFLQETPRRGRRETRSPEVMRWPWSERRGGLSHNPPWVAFRRVLTLAGKEPEAAGLQILPLLAAGPSVPHAHPLS